MKPSVVLFIALVATASVTVLANTPGSNSAGTSSTNEVQTIKTRELFIAGKRVLIRPDGTLATKYTPMRRRTTHRIVRRTNNGSNLALKTAIVKTNTTIKGVDSRLKSIETGFDAIEKKVQENQENTQTTLKNSKDALAAAENAEGKSGRVKGLITTTMYLGAIAIAIAIAAFFRRSEEILVTTEEFQSLKNNNNATHNTMKDRLSANEKELKSNTEAIKSLVAKEEARNALNTDPPTGDPPANDTAANDLPDDINKTGRFQRPTIE